MTKYYLKAELCGRQGLLSRLWYMSEPLSSYSTLENREGVCEEEKEQQEEEDQEEEDQEEEGQEEDPEKEQEDQEKEDYEMT